MERARELSPVLLSVTMKINRYLTELWTVTAVAVIAIWGGRTLLRNRKMP
jgi:hypothetical protein